VDPVNHGLVGAAAALSILRMSAPNSRRSTRWAAVGCGFVAGQAPDADRIIDAWLHPYGCNGQGLAYMLYHRGLTHTLLASLVVVPLLALLTRAVARRASPPFWHLVAIGGAGILLHLALDAANDYGVHPFYPLSRHWFYGDFLFLAEPTIASALLPYVVAAFDDGRRWVLPICSGVGAVLFPLLVVCHEWLMPFGAIVAGVWLFANALLHRRGPRPWFAWASVLTVLCGFFLASRYARARAIAWTATLAPGKTVTDVVTTPAPANPWCWRVITLTRDGDEFVARMAVKSFLTEFVDARDCFSPPHGRVPHSVELRSPLAPVATSNPARAGAEVDSRATLVLAEFVGSFEVFERMARANPRVDAARYFLRVPFWGTRRTGKNPCAANGANEPNATSLIGDLRVDYDADDVGQFCKYPFPPAYREDFRQWMPYGDPPFLH